MSSDYIYWANIAAYSFLISFVIWGLLLSRLVYGIIKMQRNIILSSIKYITNSLVFLFGLIVYASFAIIVNAIRGEKGLAWIIPRSENWLFKAILIAIFLAIFNTIFQAKVEKIKNHRLTLLLFIFDLLAMFYGIFLGAMLSFVE